MDADEVVHGWRVRCVPRPAKDDGEKSVRAADLYFTQPKGSWRPTEGGSVPRTTPDGTVSHGGHIRSMSQLHTVLQVVMPLPVSPLSSLTLL